MKKLALVLCLLFGLSACAGETEVIEQPKPEATPEMQETQKETERTEITILYTNDIHTYIDNVIKTKEGEEVPGLSYASLAALKKDLEAEGKEVILVDAGDHVQGTAYGQMDEGKGIVSLMNRIGYDAATLGNHEFDYGQYRLFGIIDQAEYPYVSSTFLNAADRTPVLDTYTVVERKGTKVAFVGISTPETITSSTPVYFMNEKGEFIYDFARSEDGEELYEAVQKAIDAAREEADYVIGLAHLGVEPGSAPYRSTDVIGHVSGLDAVIDGHSHTVMPMETVKDAEGHEVVLTQTGCYFKNIGVMTIKADGTIVSELKDSYENRDEDVQNAVDQLIEEVRSELDVEIAVNDTALYAYKPEDPEFRLVRGMEASIGDFVTDGTYYYLNMVEGLECDVALANGGGLRADLPTGVITYNNIKKVEPFGNVICLVEVKGQDLLEALEFGVSQLREPDENGRFREFGGFMHVAGMSYEVDLAAESTISVDESGMWQEGPSGAYKVHDVKVYDREKGTYEPLDPERMYRVGGANYTLRNCGDGMAMFKDTHLIKDYIGEDYLIASAYAEAFAVSEEDGEPHICSEGSPLKAYEGYLLNYEDPYGSGRIIRK